MRSLSISCDDCWNMLIHVASSHYGGFGVSELCLLQQSLHWPLCRASGRRCWRGSTCCFAAWICVCQWGSVITIVVFVAMVFFGRRIIPTHINVAQLHLHVNVFLNYDAAPRTVAGGVNCFLLVYESVSKMTSVTTAWALYITWSLTGMGNSKSMSCEPDVVNAFLGWRWMLHILQSKRSKFKAVVE